VAAVARLFALDQNFPEPIVDALQTHLEDDVELVPIRRVDRLMSELDDWQVLVALHNDGREWDGLVTTDSDMLSLPRELAVLCQTRLTLVVAVAAGHDPIKATGLVLAHIGGICQQTRPDTPQVWKLATSQRPAESPWDYLATVATRRGESTDALYRRERLSKAQLSQSPL
jgi:hypothetical protein